MDMDDINIDFRNLNRHQVLAKYVECLRQMRDLAERTCNIRGLQFDNYIIFQYFQQCHSAADYGLAQSLAMATAAGSYTQNIALMKAAVLKQIIDRRRKILYWMFYLLLALLCVSYKNEASTIVIRNIQTFTYPGMKMWRKMTLPLIKRFPSLTELYDESCLMMNPFFQVDDMNCEPCANVQNVLDLTNIRDEDAIDAYRMAVTLDDGAEQTNKDNERIAPKSVPFIFKIKQSPVDLEDFYNIYVNNVDIFRRDAYRVRSSDRHISNLDDLFGRFNSSHQKQQAQMQTQTRSSSGGPQLTSSSSSSSSSTSSPTSPRSRPVHFHNLWRCNRMLPARLMRPVFARPEHLPSTGTALERFITVDTAHAPSYTLPDTECANVYVQQALGARFIILRPTTECRNRCRTLSVRLPQSFVLSYNWWYWKPISAPDPMSETLSISFIGSYC